MSTLLSQILSIAYDTEDDGLNTTDEDLSSTPGSCHGPCEDGLLELLDRILVSSNADVKLATLERRGLLKPLLPEVHALIDFHLSCVTHHKDLWSHTLAVLMQTPAEPDLRWCALMHDTGKIATRSVAEGRRIHFIGHEPVGAWLMRRVGARLKMANPRIERIVFAIEHHARVNAYETCWTDAAIRRLITMSGDRLGDLLTFAAADWTTQRPERRARIRRRMRELHERIEAIKSGEAKQVQLPHKLGETLKAELGLAPGPELGRAIQWLKKEASAGRIEPSDKASDWVRAIQRYLPEDSSH